MSSTKKCRNLLYTSFGGPASWDFEIKSYLQEALTEVIYNLPLNDSYPENVKEAVNKVYYDNLDAMKTVYISDRGYGWIECSFYMHRNKYDKNSFYIERSDEFNGVLIIH